MDEGPEKENAWARIKSKVPKDFTQPVRAGTVRCIKLRRRNPCLF